MEEHRPTKEEREEFLAQLEQEGMPKTCGICEKFTECTNANPEEICLWLKKYRDWQGRE